MKINQAGLDLIKEFEGFRPLPYLCPAGVWTIGYGHTRGVKSTTARVTKQEAERLLREDVADTAKYISAKVAVPLTENQFSALVSLVFNVGTGPIDKTLGRKLNQGDYAGAASEFGRWCHIGTAKVYGLVRRREAETALFLTP